MEEVKEIIDLIVNSKVGIIVAASLMFISGFIRIINITSIGKKALRTLTNQHNTNNKNIETLLDENAEIKRNYDNEIRRITDEYELRVYNLKEYYKPLEQLVLNVSKSIVNDKVDKLLNDYYENRKNKVEPVLSDEIEKAYQQGKKDAIEFLDNRISKLEENLNNGKLSNE